MVKPTQKELRANTDNLNGKQLRNRMKVRKREFLNIAKQFKRGDIRFDRAVAEVNRLV